MTTATASATASPLAVPPGQGKKYWLVGDQLTIKVPGDRNAGRFALAETTVAPGGGPPPHIHHREDETFYILEGKLRLGFDRFWLERGPGSALFLPRGIPHVFKNIGETPAKFLVLATPCGFEQFVAEAGDPIDGDCCNRPVCDKDIARLLSVCPGHQLEILPQHSFSEPGPQPSPSRRLWVMGHRITLKLTSSQTQGRLSLVDVESPAGAAVPVHTHRNLDELFYVVEGAYRFTIDGQTIDAPAGTTLHVPPGVRHGFANASGRPATLVDVHFPGGFENFFEECGIAAGDEMIAPQQPPLDPRQLLTLLDRHGMDLG